MNESLHSHLLTKTMETEERMELPWNAWIAAKSRRESVAQQPASTLAPMPENQQLHVPASPNARRRSFQQWLNEKDMEQLRQMHEQSQIEERNDAERTGRQEKGKSFEEWLEDKHRESQREKEKLKEKEEVEKSEVEKKMRRRRMSQQKYQSWLQEKELKALEEEEKLLGEAKDKLEKMKVKWEEEDEMKKKTPMAMGKLPVGRTKSCPTSNPEEGRKISRQRFSSLQVTSK